MARDSGLNQKLKFLRLVNAWRLQRSNRKSSESERIRQEWETRDSVEDVFTFKDLLLHAVWYAEKLVHFLHSCIALARCADRENAVAVAALREERAWRDQARNVVVLGSV